LLGVAELVAQEVAKEAAAGDALAKKLDGHVKRKVCGDFICNLRQHPVLSCC